jgi:hypothetical protein
MSDNNNWPGKPGVPLNPEWDGWHWISLLGGKDNAQVIEWFSDAMCWDETDWTTEDFGLHARSLGPALTPAELESRFSEAMKWRTAIYDALTEWHDPPRDGETPKAALRRLVHTEILAALDPAVSRPAADLVANARRDALEELERHFKEAAAGTPLGHEDRQRGASTYNWLMYCVSTIRALKGEGDE